MNHVDTILNKSFNSGISGLGAMTIQVSSLMWLRTTINYQYKYGDTTLVAMKKLYKQGGVLRFYKGILPSLIQAPLSRFGDTACNTGINMYLNSREDTKKLPLSIKTLGASLTSGLWRIFLMPIDTTKSFMQVNGSSGLKNLKTKIKINGPRVLYNGSLGVYATAISGHFPWFFTYNYLQEHIPKSKDNLNTYIRNGFIGFCSSFSSDCVSNCFRVIKVTKQTHKTQVTYNDCIKYVINKDGIQGLFIRGLKTKIIANGVQGAMFSVLWKYFEKKL